MSYPGVVDLRRRVEKVRALINEDRSGGLQKNVALAFRLANEVPELLDLIEVMQDRTDDAVAEIAEAISYLRFDNKENVRVKLEGAYVALRRALPARPPSPPPADEKPCATCGGLGVVGSGPFFGPTVPCPDCRAKEGT